MTSYERPNDYNRLPIDWSGIVRVVVGGTLILALAALPLLLS